MLEDLLGPRFVKPDFLNRTNAVGIANGLAWTSAVSYTHQMCIRDSPYTDIIVNTVPPVPADHSNYPNMDQTRIDDFNMALLSKIGRAHV